MGKSVFFRLLKTPIDDKGDALVAQVADLNATGEAGEYYMLDPASFSLISGSPFAYWATESMFRIFREMPPAEGNVASFRLGLKTNDDFRFLRLFWEVAPETIGRIWHYHCKGGKFSPYYDDVHLLLDWEDNAEHLREFSRERGESPSRNIRSESHYLRPGLTWPRRTQKGLNVRALPADSIFADKGPAVFVDNDGSDELLDLLGVLNSLPLAMLVELQMAFGSYEVGVLQRTPIPPKLGKTYTRLTPLVYAAHNLQRDLDRTDETTHAFCLPGLVQQWETCSLLQASLVLEAEAQAAQACLADIQAEIDDLVFDLYGLGEADREMVRREMGSGEMGSGERNTESAEGGAERMEGEREDLAPPADLPVRVQNFLMWCVGIAFGRWDVRKALDPGLLPPLGGPFDPLPRCAPGALVGTDGLPASKDNIASEANVLAPVINVSRLNCNAFGHICSVAGTVADVALLIAVLCFVYCFVLWATSFIGRRDEPSAASATQAKSASS